MFLINYALFSWHENIWVDNGKGDQMKATVLYVTTKLKIAIYKRALYNL